MNLLGQKANQLSRSFNKKLNEINSPLGLYAPTIARTLAKMEDMGWIIRKEEKDKRKRHIRLTEDALKMFPKLY